MEINSGSLNNNKLWEAERLNRSVATVRGFDANELPGNQNIFQSGNEEKTFCGAIRDTNTYKRMVTVTIRYLKIFMQSKCARKVFYSYGSIRVFGLHIINIDH